MTKNYLKNISVKIAVVLIFSLLIIISSGCITKSIPVLFTYTGYSDYWSSAQGLADDGKYFYFVGHNDKTGENADIHKIDMETLIETTIFLRSAPLHGAEIDYNPYTDTLFICSGGNGITPYVYEVDKTNGILINQWNFEGVGENGGALLTVIDKNSIILFTSSKNGAKIAFTQITLGANGDYILGNTIKYSQTDLGVPQGLDRYGDCFYYLADAGITVSANPHLIYKINISNGTLDILETYSVRIPTETEGLTIAEDGTAYIGTARTEIIKLYIDFSVSAETQTN